MLPTNKLSLDKSLDNAVNVFGKVTVLINNAAIDSPPSAPKEENGPFENYPEESWNKIMDVNLKSIFYALKCLELKWLSKITAQ